MRKKILAFVIIVSIFINVSVSVSAENSTFDFDCKINYDPDTCIVSGEISINEPIENVLFSLRVQSSNGDENFADIFKSDKEGKCAFSYCNDGASGQYNLRVFAVKENVLKSFVINHKLPGFWQDLASEFNVARKGGNKNSVKNLYESYAQDLMIDVTKANTVVDFYDLILGNYKEMGDFKDRADIINEFYGALLLDCQKKNDYSSLNDLISQKDYFEALKPEKYIPETDGVSVFKLQDEKLQGNIIQFLSNASCDTIEDLRRNFGDLTLLTTVKLADSYIDVRNIIEAYYEADKLHFDISGDKLPDNNYIYKNLIGKEFSSVKELETAYSKEVYEINTSDKKTSSSGGGVGGGVGGNVSVNQKQNEKTEATILLNITDVFNDLGEFNWAFNHIEKIYQTGIMKGVSENTFAPDKNLTRAEAAAILVRLNSLVKKDIPVKDIGFIDVSENMWYYNDIRMAYSYGLMNGVSDKEFLPEALITREDFSCVVWRILSGWLDNCNAEIDFEDNNEISNYAEESITNMTYYGILKGKSSTMFCPKDAVMRVEAATILSRALDKIDK